MRYLILPLALLLTGCCTISSIESHAGCYSLCLTCCSEESP
jgi:hypothetical protein